MDILTLYLTGRLTHRRTNKIRLVSGAAVGALFGTVVTAMDLHSAFLTVLLGFVSSMLMILISYRGYSSFGPMLRDTLILWGVGAVTGGVMTAILSLGDPVYFSGSGGYSSVFILCVLVSVSFIRLISQGSSKRSAKVTFTHRGREYAVEGLVDSGNIVTEPISGAPVVILSASVVSASDIAQNPSIRVIPIRSVAGERLLYGFKPERIHINKIEVNAIVAQDTDTDNFGGMEALVPAVLIK